MIKIGPAGLGGVEEAEERLERYKKLGLNACEIAFTYGVYIKEDDAKKIGEKAKELDIQLTIHAPYWINLNSEEREKIEKSKERILNSLKIGDLLNASLVVFHPGYYGKMDKKKTFENIKKEILELQEKRKELKIKTQLAGETTGKKNVFGSIEEIKKLVDETGIRFCLDIAHIKARYGENRISLKELFKMFKGPLHLHFSGIEYGEKGEKKHKLTEEKEIEELVKNIPKQRRVTIINESPMPVEDSVKTLLKLKEQNRIV